MFPVWKCKEREGFENVMKGGSSRFESVKQGGCSRFESVRKEGF